MLSEKFEQSSEAESVVSHFTDDLNDHRNHIVDRKGRAVDDSPKNDGEGTYHAPAVKPVSGDANAKVKNRTSRRGSFVERPRAASMTKLSSSVGKKLGLKTDTSRSIENRATVNAYGATVNDGNITEKVASRESVASDGDSIRSRDSKETAEDVCLPMEREQVKINDIDFGIINEFIKEERQRDLQEQAATKRSRNRSDTCSNYATSNAAATPFHLQSIAARKYTPIETLKSIFQRSSVDRQVKTDLQLPSVDEEQKTDSDSGDSNSAEEVKFGDARVTGTYGDATFNRFSFFHSESEETVHAPDIPSLVPNGESIQELFHNGEETWWLDCTCPTDAEMKMLAKAFGIHPLTAEDIRMQETREKVELFKSYYFVCFHTFEADKESEDYLEPINVYIVVFRDGILTFHFSPLTHPASVRRRVRQLRDYVDVTADWLCYAMIDDITDSFAPAIQAIEYEADVIEDAVFTSRESDFSRMLQRIGESRRKVMTLMRLLSGKADVIKMFAKRCQDDANFEYKGARGRFNENDVSYSTLSSGSRVYTNMQAGDIQKQHNFGNARPRAEIALYLGDIQDHIITMFQNLTAYEKIFSRSHSNYLAQLQCESLGENNKVTQMFFKVTIIGTMLVPLNLVTGLFGMNVKVPGQDSHIAWFYGILGVLLLLLGLSVVFANLWMKRMNARIDSQPRPVFSARKSFKSLNFGNRSINSFV
ncbi:Magnesium transporter ALR1 [Candida parapsilosis]|nr:Magnesium transporter ALR1 [Candida parapsilosis]